MFFTSLKDAIYYKNRHSTSFRKLLKVVKCTKLSDGKTTNGYTVVMK